MSELVLAIYQNGVFKPLQTINLPDHQRVKLEIIPEGETSLVESQKRALLELAGMGNSGLTDAARKHNTYLYQKDS
jgi:predicted DNA-binding antitoxin AbrB/MazE fold protein